MCAGAFVNAVEEEKSRRTVTAFAAAFTPPSASACDDAAISVTIAVAVAVSDLGIVGVAVGVAVGVGDSLTELLPS